jgi:hypothetical protein
VNAGLAFKLGGWMKVVVEFQSEAVLGKNPQYRILEGEKKTRLFLYGFMWCASSPLDAFW